MAKKILVALPDGMLPQIDRIAKAEHRTRSDLIREALRRYIKESKARRASDVFADPRSNIQDRYAYEAARKRLISQEGKSE